MISLQWCLRRTRQKVAVRILKNTKHHLCEEHEGNSKMRKVRPAQQQAAHERLGYSKGTPAGDPRPPPGTWAGRAGAFSLVAQTTWFSRGGRQGPAAQSFRPAQQQAAHERLGYSKGTPAGDPRPHPGTRAGRAGACAHAARAGRANSHDGLRLSRCEGSAERGPRLEG
jgi:hypothetical protein